MFARFDQTLFAIVTDFNNTVSKQLISFFDRPNYSLLLVTIIVRHLLNNLT